EMMLLSGVAESLALSFSFFFFKEEEEEEGRMYVKAMVVDKDFPEDRKPRKLSPVKVTALGGGDLEATFTFMREDRCVQKKILMRKTEEPGKFSAYGGRKLIYVQELPGRDHFVFYCKDQHRGGLFHMGKLVSEGPGHVAVPTSAHLGPPHLQVGIPTSTWRPWKNLRNSCSTRDSRRRTFSCPCRRVRGRLSPSLHPESTLLPDTEPGPPGPTLQP
uniref:Odorant binding protein 2A n=1 Tax=Theropithecus gelada TaxID=9565 RepID=A0A8D2F3I1_THEGE